MFKKNLKVYAILAVMIFVVGFGIVKAQSNNNGVLGQIIEIMKLSQNESVDNNLGVVVDEGFNKDSQTVVVSKKVPYSDITTSGATVVNTVTGDFLVENVVLETNAYSIASGTKLQVAPSGDSYGTSTTVFDTDVAAFPKATTMDLNTGIGSVVGTYSGYASSTQRILLEDASSLIVKCTGADCKTSELESGTGYLRVTTVLREVDNWSSTY